MHVCVCVCVLAYAFVCACPVCACVCGPSFRWYFQLFNRQYREASALVHESFISDAESADTSDGYTTEEYCFDSAAEDGDSDLDYCHDNGGDRHGCASGDAAKKAIKMKCKTARPPQNLAAAEEQEVSPSPDTVESCGKAPALGLSVSQRHFSGLIRRHKNC